MKCETIILKKLISRKHKDKEFKKLLNLYHERLYWQIRKFVITHENANDVLQNSFMKIYKGLPNFKEQSSLFTWMHKIAYNESMRFLDKDKKTYCISLDNINDKHLDTLVADSFFEGNEVQLKLQQILLSLPEKQRHIFQMKYYDDLKFREIEKILEIKESTLKSSYYKTVEHIKHNMSVVELLKNT